MDDKFRLPEPILFLQEPIVPIEKQTQPIHIPPISLLQETPSETSCNHPIPFQPIQHMYELKWPALLSTIKRFPGLYLHTTWDITTSTDTIRGKIMCIRDDFFVIQIPPSHKRKIQFDDVEHMHHLTC
jgi:hypothetical protein